MVTDHFRCSVTATTRLLHPHEETAAFSISYLFLVSRFTPFFCEIIIEKKHLLSFFLPKPPSDLWHLTFLQTGNHEQFHLAPSRQADSGEFFGNKTTTATTQAARSLAWSVAYKHLKK